MVYQEKPAIKKNIWEGNKRKKSDSSSQFKRKPRAKRMKHTEEVAPKQPEEVKEEEKAQGGKAARRSAIRS